MKTLQKGLLAVVCLVSVACQSQNPKETMEQEIKTVINTFVTAGAQRDVSMYNDIIHPEFRVIANQYPTPDKTSIIPAEGYIALISKEVIGGTAYKIQFQSIEIINHSATVIAKLKSDTGGQIVTYLLVQNPENKWQIITNMAVQTK